METTNEKVDESKTSLPQNSQSGVTNGQSNTNGVTETNNGNSSSVSASDAGSKGLLPLRKTGSAGGKATDSQSSNSNHHTEGSTGGPKEKNDRGKKGTTEVNSEVNSVKKHTDRAKVPLNGSLTPVNGKSAVKTKVPSSDKTTKTITDKGGTTGARTSPAVATKRTSSPVGSRPDTPLEKIPRARAVNAPPINQLPPLPPIKPKSPPDTPSDSEHTLVVSQNNKEDLTNTPPGSKQSPQSPSNTEDTEKSTPLDPKYFQIKECRNNNSSNVSVAQRLTSDAKQDAANNSSNNESKISCNNDKNSSSNNGSNNSNNDSNSSSNIQIITEQSSEGNTITSVGTKPAPSGDENSSNGELSKTIPKSSGTDSTKDRDNISSSSIANRTREKPDSHAAPASNESSTNTPAPSERRTPAPTGETNKVSDLDPVMKSVYLGRCAYADLPPLTKKVVRIFVSSTFSGKLVK